MLPPLEPIRSLRLRPDAAGPLEALVVAACPHLEAIVDVGSGPNGDLVVHLPTPRIGLPALLAAREAIAPGEAVTLLVPLLEAMSSMHAAGVAHGAVGTAAVLLSDEGAPYWSAPEAPVLRRLVSEGTFVRAADEDCEAMAGLAAGILGRAGLSAPPAAELSAERVFALAEPQAVRFADPPGEPEDRSLPQRLVPPQAPSADGAPAEVLGRLRALRRSVRPRVWAAAGAAAALLLLAVVLLPSGRGDAAASSVTRASSPPSRGAPSARPTAVTSSTAPVDAVRALLDARARCVTAGDAACLDRVDASGSPVRTADRAAVAAGVDPVRVGAGRVVLRASGGGTALAEVGGATVLAVRQPDGWRLRDVIAVPR